MAVVHSLNVVCHSNELTLRHARLVLGRMTPQYCNQPTRPSQPFISPALLDQVPALIGWDKGGNVTSARCLISDGMWVPVTMRLVAKFTLYLIIVRCRRDITDECRWSAVEQCKVTGSRQVRRQTTHYTHSHNCCHPFHTPAHSRHSPPACTQHWPLHTSHAHSHLSESHNTDGPSGCKDPGLAG